MDWHLFLTCISSLHPPLSLPLLLIFLMVSTHLPNQPTPDHLHPSLTNAPIIRCFPLLVFFSSTLFYQSFSSNYSLYALLSAAPRGTKSKRKLRGQTAFSATASTLWNDLPLHIKIGTFTVHF